MDYLTKCVQFAPAKNTTSKATISKIPKSIQHNRFPELQRNYIYLKFEELTRRHSIKHTLKSTTQPQTTRLAKQQYNTLLAIMHISIEYSEGSDWNKHIIDIERYIHYYFYK